MNLQSHSLYRDVTCYKTLLLVGLLHLDKTVSVQPVLEEDNLRLLKYIVVLVFYWNIGPTSV